MISSANSQFKPMVQDTINTTPPLYATNLNYVGINKVGNAVIGSPNVLTTLLNVTGAGVLNFLGSYVPTARTTRTMRVVVTLDGTVIIDATYDTATSAYKNVLVGGLNDHAGGAFAFENIIFESSLKIQYSFNIAQPAANEVSLLYKARVYK